VGRHVAPTKENNVTTLESTYLNSTDLKSRDVDQARQYFDHTHSRVLAVTTGLKIPDRSIKAKAPDFIQPKGEWTLPAALDRLSRNYERLTGFVESTPDLREHVLESPPLRVVTNGAIDAIDGYQWALTVAAHDERHVRQILELKADPNYPGS
jgi:hypothetical protein